MAEYNILIENVPVGGTAVANLTVTDNDVAEDMTSVRAIWKDQTGATIVDMTRTTADISTTGSHGEAATLTDPSGTGTYKSTLVIHSTYSTGTFPKTFTLTVTVTDPDGNTKTTVFTFSVVASSLDITLDSTSVINSVRRQTGLMKDVTYLAEGDEATTQNDLLSLGDEIIYGIEAAYKNGAVLAAGSSGNTYTWVTYRPNVKVNTTPAANDHYLFTVKVGMTDAAIEEIILNARRRVLSALQPHYRDASLATYPTVLSLVRDIALGEIREQTARGVAMESAFYRSGRDLKKEAFEKIKRIQRGVDSVVDSSDTIVARNANSLMGGFENSEGVITQRSDWWTRLRLYDQSVVRPSFNQDAASATEA